MLPCVLITCHRCPAMKALKLTPPPQKIAAEAIATSTPQHTLAKSPPLPIGKAQPAILPWAWPGSDGRGFPEGDAGKPRPGLSGHPEGDAQPGPMHQARPKKWRAVLWPGPGGAPASAGGGALRRGPRGPWPPWPARREAPLGRGPSSPWLWRLARRAAPPGRELRSHWPRRAVRRAAPLGREPRGPWPQRAARWPTARGKEAQGPWPRWPARRPTTRGRGS